MRHSNQAVLPSRMGSPRSPRRQFMLPNRLMPRVANTAETSRWVSARILTAKCCAASKAPAFEDSLPRQTSTSGGSSETDVKELAVKPLPLWFVRQQHSGSPACRGATDDRARSAARSCHRANGLLDGTDQFRAGPKALSGRKRTVRANRGQARGLSHHGECTIPKDRRGCREYDRPSALSVPRTPAPGRCPVRSSCSARRLRERPKSPTRMRHANRGQNKSSAKSYPKVERNMNYVGSRMRVSDLCGLASSSTSFGFFVRPTRQRSRQIGRGESGDGKTEASQGS